MVGGFVAGAIPGRILAAMFGFPAGAEYAHHLINFKLVDQINQILQTNPALSIVILILTLILAAILGGIVGWLTSYPAIRLKEAYLGITLLAFGDVLMTVGWNYDPLIGGTQGVIVPDPFRWTGEIRFLVATFMALGLALLVLYFIELLTRSPFGRALKSMRDDEIAARVYGKDIVRLRTYALIIGSALAGMAGAFYILYAGSCKAITFTRLTWTFWPWAFMMLGGTGNNFGVAIGVLVFVIVRTIIIAYRGYLRPYVPFDPVWLEYTFVGLAITLIALLRPQGIIPEKPALTLPKERIANILKEVKEEVKKEKE